MGRGSEGKGEEGSLSCSSAKSACQETQESCWLWACSREGPGEELLSVKCPTPHLLFVPSASQNLALMNSDHIICCLNSWMLLSAKRVLLIITLGPSQLHQTMSPYLTATLPSSSWALPASLMAMAGDGPVCLAPSPLSSIHLNSHPLPHLR